MIVRLPNPLSAVVWLAFLIPGSLLGGRLDQALAIIILLVGCAVLIAKPSPWEARRPSALALKFFLALEFLYIVSFMYSAAFNGIQIRLADFFELLRYVFLGGFVIYLIRHYDGHVRAAMEWAMTTALYVALLFPAADPQGYVSVMTLCYLLFFSRARLRFLHCASAVVVVSLAGDRWCWAAASLVVSAAMAVRLYGVLIRRRAKSAALQSILLFAALAAVPAVYLGSHLAPATAARASSETEAIESIRRSPVFGWGPAGREEIPSRGSQYALWLLKGGVLSAVLIAAGLAICAVRLLQAARGDLGHLVGAAFFLVSVAIMLEGGQFLESFRLFFLTSFFVAGMIEASR